MHTSPRSKHASSLEGSESLRHSMSPRSGMYLRTQNQPISGSSGSPQTSHSIIISSPTPLTRQPANYKHATASILPANLKSITSTVISEGRAPSSFTAAAASTTASQLSTLMIAGPVFSSLQPRAAWQKLEVDSMASAYVASQPESPVSPTKTRIRVSPQRQRQLEGSGGVAPSSRTTARECIVEARRIVQHFVSGRCSEAAFCSVVERSSGHERWALLSVLKAMLCNAAHSEEHRESLLLVRVPLIIHCTIVLPHASARLFAGGVCKDHVTLPGACVWQFCANDYFRPRCSVLTVLLESP